MILRMTTPAPTPPPDYALHEHEGVTVVSLNVQSLLSILDVTRLGAELRELIDGGARRVVLDLRNVKFAGSAGLGMLLELAAALKSRGGKLVLAGAQHLEPLLKVTRARGVFDIAPDTITAMSAAKA
jgi:anti-sigma B factor antagonist